MTTTPDALAGPIMLRSSHDLLASIPYQLGFRPTESVVLACVTRRRRLDLVARVGLDDLGTARRPALATLAHAVEQVDPVWCALVVYTGQDEAAVATQVAAVREVVGQDVELDEWIVGPDGYRGMGCDDVTCCPVDGHPLTALDVSPAGVAHVLAGRFAAASADEAFGIVPAPRAERALCARAARRSEEARERDQTDPSRWRQDALSAWRTALRDSASSFAVADAGIAVALLGRVAAALGDRRVRDAALLTLLPGADEAADSTIDPDASVDAATARAMSSVTDPASGVRPDPVRVRSAVRLLERTVAQAPRRLTPAPLTLLAFLAWWQGDGPRASYRLTQVHDVDPGYRLALLLGGVLSAGLAPGWIRAGSVPAAAGRGRTA